MIRIFSVEKKKYCCNSNVGTKICAGTEVHIPLLPDLEENAPL